jgi:hypothetical protein
MGKAALSVLTQERAIKKINLYMHFSRRFSSYYCQQT